MAINKLAHVSVRTTDLEASKRFYCDLLGFSEGFRPPFEFPGAWLYRGGDEADFGVLHIIGVDADDPGALESYLGAHDPAALHGSGAVDHIAFLASDLSDMRQRLQRLDLHYRERTVPSLKLHQLFIEDPSGITIELNFSADEAAD